MTARMAHCSLVLLCLLLCCFVEVKGINSTAVSYTNVTSQGKDLWWLKRGSWGRKRGHHFLDRGSRLEKMKKRAKCSTDEDDCQNGGICVKFLFNKMCICPRGISGERCELVSNSTVSGGCRPFSQYCFLHCEYGYKVNKTDNCKLCQCQENPCTSNFKCAKEEVCYLHKPPCKTYPCNPQPKCKAILDSDGCKSNKACTLDKTCSFGLAVDSNGCQQCKCAQDPCQNVKCEVGRTCALEENYCYNAYKNTLCRGKIQKTKYRTVCRAKNKPGNCPNNIKDSLTKIETFRGNAVSPKLSFVGSISGGVVGGSKCKQLCKTDADCPGLEHCCSNGCGSQCTMPVLEGSKLCQLMHEEALSSNQTWYIPQCDDKGMFKLIQCKNMTWGEKVCHCVDPKSGESIGKETSEYLCRNLLKTKRCSVKLNCQNKTCEFGFQKDEFMCPTCECEPSPCQEKKCDEGKVCEVIKTIQYIYSYSSQKQQNIHLTICIDAAWQPCPKGEPLRDEDSNRPLICRVEPDTYLSSSSQRNFDTCPSSYYCTDAKHESITQIWDRKGVCCPSSEQDVKPGVCPTPLELIPSSISKREYRYHKRRYGRQHNYYGQYGTCKHTCSHDMDCTGDLKCCPSDCNDDFNTYGSYGYERDQNFTSCQVPTYDHSNSTCTPLLNKAIMAMKIQPDVPVFIPRCKYNGEWQQVQCHDFYGLCWCIEKDGTRVPNSMVRGTPHCDSLDEDDNVKTAEVCPGGEPVYICSLELCENRECRAYPGAVCRINPCAGCTVDFYDSYNNRVDCNEGLSQCRIAEAEALIKQGQGFPDYSYTPVIADLMLQRLKRVRGDLQSAKGEDSEKNKTSYTSTYDQWGKEQVSISKQFEDFLKRRQPSGKCPSRNTVEQLLSAVLQKSSCIDLCQTDSDCKGIGAICCPGEKCGHACWTPSVVHRDCDKPIDESCVHKYRYTNDFWRYDKSTGSCESYRPTCNAYQQQHWKSYGECVENCAEVYPLAGVYIPTCKESDDSNHAGYTSRQCLDGLCWCVTEDGAPVEVTLTKGHMECMANGTVTDTSDVQAVCPDDSSPQICTDACLNAVCYPSSPADEEDKTLDVKKYETKLDRLKRKVKLHVRYYQCRADPCNKCRVTHYDVHGKEVKCATLPICEQPKTLGSCSGHGSTRWFYDQATYTCQPFQYSGCDGNSNNFPTLAACRRQCGGRLCDDGSQVKPCDNACHNATCETMPEALCFPDPCTCQPQFYHPERFQPVECKGKEHSLCERARLKAEQTQLLTSDSAYQIHIPDCMEDGSFKPLQCQDHHRVCWCVDEWGAEINESKIFMDSWKYRNTVNPCVKMEATQLQAEVYFIDALDTILKDKDDFKRQVNETLATQLGVLPENVFFIHIHELLDTWFADVEENNDLSLRDAEVLVWVQGSEDLTKAAAKLNDQFWNENVTFTINEETIAAHTWSYAMVRSDNEKTLFRVESYWEEVQNGTRQEAQIRIVELVDEDHHYGVVAGVLCACAALVAIAVVVALFLRHHATCKVTLEKLGFANQTYDDPVDPNFPSVTVGYEKFKNESNA